MSEVERRRQEEEEEEREEDKHRKRTPILHKATYRNLLDVRHTEYYKIQINQPFVELCSSCNRDRYRKGGHTK